MIRARTNSGEQVERPADHIRGGALAASTVQTNFLFWGVGGPVSISTPHRSLYPRHRRHLSAGAVTPDHHTRRRPRPDLDARTGPKSRGGPAVQVRAANFPKCVYTSSEARPINRPVFNLFVGAPDKSGISRDVWPGRTVFRRPKQGWRIYGRWNVQQRPRSLLQVGIKKVGGTIDKRDIFGYIWIYNGRECSRAEKRG